MADDKEPKNIAVHSTPAQLRRANYILQVDLAVHGLPGRYEQLWCSTVASGGYRLCCVPFFTYGMALGDILEANRDGLVTGVIERSGHKNLRL